MIKSIFVTTLVIFINAHQINSETSTTPLSSHESPTAIAQCKFNEWIDPQNKIQII